MRAVQYQQTIQLHACGRTLWRLDIYSHICVCVHLDGYARVDVRGEMSESNGEFDVCHGTGWTLVPKLPFADGNIPTTKSTAAARFNKVGVIDVCQCIDSMIGLGVLGAVGDSSSGRLMDPDSAIALLSLHFCPCTISVCGVK